MLRRRHSASGGDSNRASDGSSVPKNDGGTADAGDGGDGCAGGDTNGADALADGLIDIDAADAEGPDLAARRVPDRDPAALRLHAPDAIPRTSLERAA